MFQLEYVPELLVAGLGYKFPYRSTRKKTKINTNAYFASSNACGASATACSPCLNRLNHCKECVAPKF